MFPICPAPDFPGHLTDVSSRFPETLAVKSEQPGTAHPMVLFRTSATIYFCLSLHHPEEHFLGNSAFPINVNMTTELIQCCCDLQQDNNYAADRSHLTGAIHRFVLVPGWMETFSPGENCDRDESATTRQSWESQRHNLLQMVSIISVLILKTLPVPAPLHPSSPSVSG